jgi:neutral ceramidase
MTSLHAGAGTTDITPDTPVPLAGSETRTAPFTRVADRLEANALVLEQEGRRVVLVTADLMFIGGELRAGVLQRLAGTLGDAELFLAASHTHFAPATDDRRPLLGRMSAAYLEQVCDRVSGLVAGLLRRRLEPARVAYARGQADHAVNRRLRAAWHLSRRGPKVGAVVAAPNSVGPRDESVHVLRVLGAERQPLAVVWSYACHPVAFPRPLEVTAEYPGRVRQRLRERAGSDTPVLFLQGFAGDIRPPELDRSASASGRARRRLLGPRFGRFTPDEWERWADSLSARVAEVAAAAGDPVAGELRLHRISRPVQEFVLGAPNDQQVSFHLVSLGRVTIVGISAEVVTEYGPLLRSTLGSEYCIPVGYIDDVYGYLPTARMLREGGYEADWFLRPFALRGPVNPMVEAHCTAALRALAAPDIAPK